MAKTNNISLSHRLSITAVIGLLLFSFALAGQNIGGFLKSSVVGYPSAPAFDGTVAPVKKVPNWSKVSYNKAVDTYSSFKSSEFVSLPKYDASVLRTPTDSLVWGNSADNVIRNAKLTFSVPYLGNYRLDGVEGAGSHPAVDIRVPMHTPIYSIANGVVVKVSTQSSGFGHHIVVRHDNVPTLENPNAKTTLYSSYSHLSDILVKNGDVVTKGQQIAFSGDTGSSTTPHIHFQIDNDSAPWHPFWPFSYSEASDAGLNFYSAINSGFHQDKARRTTVNPMMYVQHYATLTSVPSATIDDPVEPTPQPSEDTSSYVPPVVDPVPVVEPNVTDDTVTDTLSPDSINPIIEDKEPSTPPVEVLDPPELSFDFVVKNTYVSDDKNASFSVLLRDQYGNVFDNGFRSDIVVKSTNGLVTPKSPILTYFNFSNEGEFISTFRRMNPGKDRLEITYGGEKYFSDWFQVLENDVSNSDTRFSDVKVGDEYYKAIEYLARRDIISGYEDGTFKPDQPVSRVEALKFIYEGIKASVSSGSVPFNDVSVDAWYSKYLYTAYKNGVVAGYPDGTFKPAQTVNRAEFYKLLFTGMGVQVPKKVSTVPFSDVKTTDWYAPYAYYAKRYDIVPPNVLKLNASVGMSRGEVAYGIYMLMKGMK